MQGSTAVGIHCRHRMHKGFKETRVQTQMINTGSYGTWGVWPMTRRLQLVRSSTWRSWLQAWYLS